MSIPPEAVAQAGEAPEAKAVEILDRPVLLFAGQGSQAAGMGRDLAERDARAMLLWQEAERASGLPLRGIYWEGDEKDMADTRALQPALTVVNCSLWSAHSKNNPIRPLACAGHSLGEYSALAAAGVISPEAAIQITALRGRLMAEADPEGAGAMAAIVKLSEDEVERIVEEAAAETGEALVAANYNSPTQIVVSGAKRAVEAARAKAKERKGRAVPLQVSGAFHSPLMEEANRALAPALEKVEWRDPVFPVYCNVDGRPVHKGADAKRRLLRQMVSPVYWLTLVRSLYLAGARWYLEISPRAVLGKMIGPSMAGIAGQCDNLRVELINSLSSALAAL